MKGTTIAIFACMFLALEFVFSKVLLTYMSPLVLSAISSVATAVILFLILEAEHKVWEVFRLKRSEFVALLVVGIVSGILAQLFYVTGLKESTATNAVLLTRLNSLLIAVMGVVFIREKVRWHHIIGAALMVSGIVIIVTRGFAEKIQPAEGDVLLLLAAICWASSNIIMKKYLSRVPPEVIVVGYFAFSGLALMIVAAKDIPGEMTPEAIMYMTGLVVFVGIIGRYLWYYSFEHTSACNVGLASLSIPLFGVIYAVTLLGETMQIYQSIGGAMIFFGLVTIETHLIRHKDVCEEDVEHRLKRHHPHN
jgi:drug/metabolite transporter (DMT)-like permease